MAKSVLSAAHFQDETAAFAYVETALWPDGPYCPFCGATEEHVGKLEGKTTRPGLRKCYACKKPFTVRQRDHFRVQPFEAASLAARDPSHVCQQEGHQHPPNSTDASMQHENRVVPYPPHP